MRKFTLVVVGLMLMLLAMFSIGITSFAEKTLISEEQIAAVFEWREQLEEEKGRFYTWSIEDKYWWQQEVWDVLKDRETLLFGLPREGDITENEARSIALTTIQTKYGSVAVDPSPTHEGSEAVWYRVDDPKRHVWDFDFMLYNVGGRIGTFHVTIDAVTGEVVKVDDGKGGH